MFWALLVGAVGWGAGAALGACWGAEMVPKARGRWLGVALVLFAGSGYLVLDNMLAIQAARARQSWPTVTATITESTVIGRLPMPRAMDTPENRAAGPPLPQVRFSYQVGGQNYEGMTHLHPPMFGARSTQRDAAVGLIQLYPLKAEVPVYYNPADPAIAELRPGPTWDCFTRLALGFTVIFFAGWMMLSWRRARPQP